MSVKFLSEEWAEALKAALNDDEAFRTAAGQVSASYDTAAALSRGELNAVTAFMTGKIKVAGNMGLLLSLQGALTRLPDAMSSIQTEY